MIKLLTLATLAAAAIPSAQAKEEEDSLTYLDDVVVTARQKNIQYSGGVENKFQINRAELCRAACCNLGESFVTNPSVDVAYDDAATGARQIKLLGLSGAYVQMLTENLPNYRGAASPFSLGYVPGTWMQSIQVSKGAASVKNGFESITGQTNIEFLKPQTDEELAINGYFDSELGAEINAGANYHLTDKLSTGLLLHWEDDLRSHDGNDDGFDDFPRVRQVHALNRWAYFGDVDTFQAGISYLNEGRHSGQSTHHHDITDPFKISINTNRYTIFAKNAIIFDREKNTNIAIMGNGSIHSQNGRFGHKIYDVDQRSGYLSAMFESEFGAHSSLSTGLSMTHDRLEQRLRATHDTSMAPQKFNEEETTAGAYAQYTYSLEDKLTLMGGVRGDHSNLHGWFVTPRAHIKYSPLKGLNFRLSAGRGFRNVFAWAENLSLLASGRTIVIDTDLPQEQAWNYGASAMWQTEIFERPISFSAEYYYTDFRRQVIVDYEQNPYEIHIEGVQGKSYSHNLQLEATVSPIRGMSITGAWRLNDVKATLGGKLRQMPLTSRYKGLLTATYSDPLELWNFDITAQFNGPGRLPDPVDGPDGTPMWDSRFHAYVQLSAQVTRNFRNFSVYIGGENLTGYKQKNTIINAADPWSSTFDPTLIWGPVHGPMVYAGFRINISK